MSFDDFFNEKKHWVPTDVDLVVALAQEGFELKKTGKSWAGNTCPACGPGHAQSVKLSVFVGSDGRQRWKCLACGKHGDFADFLSHSRRVSLKEALSLARGMYRVGGLAPAKFHVNRAKAAAVTDSLSEAAVQAMAHVHETLLKGAHTNPAELMPYFSSRAISEETVMKLVRRNMMRFLPVSQYDAYRLLSEKVGRPALEAAGMWKEEAQWPAASYRPIISFLPMGCSLELRLNRTPPENSPKAIRYGIARYPWFYKEFPSQPAKRIIVVEGIIDLMSIIELGFIRGHDAIMGIPGTNVWRSEWFAQARTLNPNAQYIIATDGNVPGETAAKKIATALDAIGIQHQRAVPQGADDWNQYLVMIRGQGMTGTDGY